MNKYPSELLHLIAFLKKLPGVGSKTAERFSFNFLDWTADELSQIGIILASLKEKIKHCPECGCLKDSSDCVFCLPNRQEARILCIIASPKDAFAFEQTGYYRGLYHVLGGLLSPLDGRMPESLKLDRLKKRIHDLQIKEIIIALDSTLEGDATSLYLKEELLKENISVSRLAFGLPMGSSLDYVDNGTLARALSGRQIF